MKEVTTRFTYFLHLVQFTWKSLNDYYRKSITEDSWVQDY